MTGYLARLALRALGVSANARLVARVDARLAPAQDRDIGDAPAITGDKAPPSRDRSEREGDGTHATRIARAPAAEIVRVSARHSADASDRPAHVRNDALTPDVTPRTQPAASSTVARESRPSSTHVRVDKSRIDPGSVASAPSAQAQRQAGVRPAPSIAGAERHPPLKPAAPPAQPLEQPGAAPVARREVVAISGSTNDARQPVSNEPGAARERRASHVPAPLHAAPLAGTSNEPASVTVDIGRIEVKIAPSLAPPARARAAPQGFEGYWRMRNYLDRRRG